MRGHYVRAAATGRLALFSIRLGTEHAALALEPIYSGTLNYVTIRGWKLSQVHGELGTADRARLCEDAACTLIRRLNGRCPHRIPFSELWRRRRIQEALDKSRSFNSDTAVSATALGCHLLEVLASAIRLDHPRRNRGRLSASPLRECCLNFHEKCAPGEIA